VTVGHAGYYTGGRIGVGGRLRFVRNTERDTDGPTVDVYHVARTRSDERTVV